MIKFKSLRIEGFASICKPFFYVLNSPGINAIVAPNGTGKSTIFNAFCWGLYGKTLKPKTEISPWSHLGYDKGTKVEVLFKKNDDLITVIRCRNYKGIVEGKKGGNSLYLYVNDSLYFETKGKVNVNQKLEQILGMSFNLFKNSIAFGQNLTRLLREKGDKQKELFDEAFSVYFINEAREAAKNRLKELQEAAYEQDLNLENLGSQIEKLYASLESITEQEREFKVQKELKIKELKKQLKALKSLNVVELRKELDQRRKRLSELLAKKTYYTEDVKEHQELKDNMFRWELELDQLEAEKRSKESTISKFLKALSSPISKCSSCGTLLGKDRSHIKQELSNIRLKVKEDASSIEKLKGNISGGLERMALLEKKLEQNSSIIQGIDLLKHDISNFKLKIEKAKSLKIQKSSIFSQLRDTEKQEFASNRLQIIKELESLKQEQASWSQIHKKLESSVKLHTWLISDPLSNKGLKAYIFNTMLSGLNEKLWEYSQVLGWGIKFSIDLESGNKNFIAEIYRGKNVLPYEDLSGGEQQLVDICLAFAMHDLVSVNKINLLLMDEIFESLDRDNIEKVIELIHLKSKGLSIHLVTHRKEFISTGLKSIQLKKSRSGTSVVR